MELVVSSIFQRLRELVTAPFHNADIIWIALPLLITLVIVEFYFGKYKYEKLQWDHALTNTLVLVFVSLNLFQYVFRSVGEGFVKAAQTQGFYIALFVFILGILLFIIDFFHLIPKVVASLISAYLPINITAYTAIVLVYNHIALDLSTILAWLILIVVLGLIFFIIRLLEPMSMK